MTPRDGSGLDRPHVERAGTPTLLAAGRWTLAFDYRQWGREVNDKPAAYPAIPASRYQL